MALGRGSAHGAKILISHGAEIARQTFCSPPARHGQDPLFLSRPDLPRGLGWARQPLCPMLAAARTRNAECCSLVWRHSGLAIQKQNFFYAIWVFSRFGSSALLDGPVAEVVASAARLKIRPEDARKEFWAAIAKGQWACAASLLPLVDPNERSPTARSPLFVLAKNFSENVSRDVLSRFFEYCDASLLDDSNDSLLVVAAREGGTSFLRELLSRGLGGSPLGLSHDGLDILTLASSNRMIARSATAEIAEAMAIAESRELFDATPEARIPTRRSGSL